MNKRQVIILWIIAIALGVAVALVKMNQRQGAQSATDRAPGETLFASFPAADVASVQIQGAGKSVTLAKKDNRWTVAEREDFPANVASVNNFLRTLAELEVTRGMEAGPSFAPRFGMDESATKEEDRGLTATFKDAAGKEIAKVSLGKNIESGSGGSPMMGGAPEVGRYIRNHADTSGFYAVSELFPSVSADPARWLADGFISPEKIRSASVSYTDKPDTAWKVVRETEEAAFKLDGAKTDEVLESSAASSLNGLLSYARFDDVVPSMEVAGRAAAEGKRTAVIETFEGFTYTLTMTPAKSADAAEKKEGEEPAAAAADKYLLTVKVDADLPKERKKEADEKPEDAKTKDAAFADRLKTLQEKLEKEKALEGRTFEVAKSTVDALLKDRSQMVTQATPPPAENAGAGSVQKLPGGIVTTPPTHTAVTPPIEIPPVGGDSKGGDKSADDKQPADQSKPEVEPGE